MKVLKINNVMTDFFYDNTSDFDPGSLPSPRRNHDDGKGIALRFTNSRQTNQVIMEALSAAWR